MYVFIVIKESLFLLFELIIWIQLILLQAAAYILRAEKFLISIFLNASSMSYFKIFVCFFIKFTIVTAAATNAAAISQRTSQ